MNHGKRLFSFIEKASAYLDSSKADRSHPLVALFAANLDLLEYLRCLPEYTQYRNAIYDSDLAFLPNEVINDVVLIAGEERDPKTYIPADYCRLVNVAGSWGELARNSTFVSFTSNAGDFKFVSRRYKGYNGLEEVEISQEEAETKLICHTIVRMGFTDYAQIQKFKKIAAHLHGSIEITEAHRLPNSILPKIGSCFSKVVFYSAETVYCDGSLEFIQRQLQSNYLAELHFSARFQPGVLDDALIKFVSRPLFNSLYSDRKYFLSFPVINAALNAWESKDYFAVAHQQICGPIGFETKHKLGKNMQFDCRMNVRRHPNDPHARMKLQIADLCSNSSLTFSNSADANVINGN